MVAMSAATTMAAVPTGATSTPGSDDPEAISTSSPQPMATSAKTRGKTIQQTSIVMSARRARPLPAVPRSRASRDRTDLAGTHELARASALRIEDLHLVVGACKREIDVGRRRPRVEGDRPAAHRNPDRAWSPGCLARCGQRVLDGERGDEEVRRRRSHAGLACDVAHEHA